MNSTPISLRSALKEGAVIPFVGAGVSMAVRKRACGDQLFPSWRDLLLLASRRLKQENKPAVSALVEALLGLDSPRYPEAALEAQKALGPLWIDCLKAALDQPREQAEDKSLRLARAVWALNSQLVLTTNYDRVLRWACPDPDNMTIWDIEAPAEFVTLLRRGVSRPTVWHLHGTIDNAAGMILTPDGYSLLYPSATARELAYEAALQTLRSLLMSKSFLFIGFSFDDAHFGDQFRWLATTFRGYPGPHYLLVNMKTRNECACS